MSYQPTLRDRLVAKNNLETKAYESISIPASGRINTATVARVQKIAVRARAGDIEARDCLWLALRPRLNRVGWVLRPWPNTRHFTGIWDRDDVRQESWIVFVELLAAWNGKVSFIPYLLARFSWRLRDRILRGIGKRQSQFGSIRVPEEMLHNVLVASDGEQPESVAVARKLLEELLRRQMSGDGSPGELDAWFELVNAREVDVLVSPDQLLDDPPSQERVA